MLEEMRKTLLIVTLLQRARTDAEADRHLTGRRRIMHDGIAHAVRQGAEADALLHWQIAD